MQSATHPAFAAKIAVLAALLERSQNVRTEARNRLQHVDARYQALSSGDAWVVAGVSTGQVYERGLTYAAAMRLVEALEDKATHQ